MTSAKKRITLVLMVVFLCTCFSFVIAPCEVKAATFVPRLTAPDSNNPYYTYLNQYYKDGYGMPNCTCYAWGRAYEITGSRPTLSLRNANQWYGNTGDGYARGQTPKLGAIACWGYTNGGHVAVVEKIEGNAVTLSESAWGGKYFYTQTTTNVPGLYNNWQGYIYIGNFSVDTTAPQISNLWVTDLTNDGYSVYVTVTDNVGVDRVMFPTWTNANGQDDIVWLAGSKQNATTWACRIFSNRDFRGQQDIYHTHVYAYDAAGNQSNMRGTSQYVDKTAPIITDVKVSDISSKGYTVTCTATDNNKVDRVQFPTWTLNNDQDDLFVNWQTNPKVKGTQDGFTWTYRVNVSDHNNEKGLYRTHIYVYDNNGNSVYYRVPDVTVPEKDLSSSNQTTSAKPNTSASSSQTSSAIIKGDLMRKGKPTLGSFALLGQYLIKTKTLDDYQLKAADMNGDGKVSIADFTLLGKKLLGN